MRRLRSAVDRTNVAAGAGRLAEYFRRLSSYVERRRKLCAAGAEIGASSLRRRASHALKQWEVWTVLCERTWTVRAAHLERRSKGCLVNWLCWSLATREWRLQHVFPEAVRRQKQSWHHVERLWRRCYCSWGEASLKRKYFLSATAVIHSKTDLSSTRSAFALWTGWVAVRKQDLVRLFRFQHKMECDLKATCLHYFKQFRLRGKLIRTTLRNSVMHAKAAAFRTYRLNSLYRVNEKCTFLMHGSCFSFDTPPELCRNLLRQARGNVANAEKMLSEWNLGQLHIVLGTKSIERTADVLVTVMHESDAPAFDHVSDAVRSCRLRLICVRCNYGVVFQEWTSYAAFKRHLTVQGLAITGRNAFESKIKIWKLWVEHMAWIRHSWSCSRQIQEQTCHIIVKQALVCWRDVQRRIFCRVLIQASCDENVRKKVLSTSFQRWLYQKSRNHYFLRIHKLIFGASGLNLLEHCVSNWMNVVGGIRCIQVQKLNEKSIQARLFTQIKYLIVLSPHMDSWRNQTYIMKVVKAKNKLRHLSVSTVVFVEWVRFLSFGHCLSTIAKERSERNARGLAEIAIGAWALNAKEMKLLQQCLCQKISVVEIRVWAQHLVFLKNFRYMWCDSASMQLCSKHLSQHSKRMMKKKIFHKACTAIRRASIRNKLKIFAVSFNNERLMHCLFIEWRTRCQCEQGRFKSSDLVVVSFKERQCKRSIMFVFNVWCSHLKYLSLTSNRHSILRFQMHTIKYWRSVTLLSLDTQRHEVVVFHNGEKLYNQRYQSLLLTLSKRWMVWARNKSQLLLKKKIIISKLNRVLLASKCCHWIAISRKKKKMSTFKHKMFAANRACLISDGIKKWNAQVRQSHRYFLQSVEMDGCCEEAGTQPLKTRHLIELSKAAMMCCRFKFLGMLLNDSKNRLESHCWNILIFATKLSKAIFSLHYSRKLILKQDILLTWRSACNEFAIRAETQQDQSIPAVLEDECVDFLGKNMSLGNNSLMMDTVQVKVMLAKDLATEPRREKLEIFDESTSGSLLSSQVEPTTTVEDDLINMDYAQRIQHKIETKQCFLDWKTCCVKLAFLRYSETYFSTRQSNKVILGTFRRFRHYFTIQRSVEQMILGRSIALSIFLDGRQACALSSLWVVASKDHRIFTADKVKKLAARSSTLIMNLLLSSQQVLQMALHRLKLWISERHKSRNVISKLQIFLQSYRFNLAMVAWLTYQYNIIHVKAINVHLQERIATANLFKWFRAWNKRCEIEKRALLWMTYSTVRCLTCFFDEWRVTVRSDSPESCGKDMLWMNTIDEHANAAEVKDIALPPPKRFFSESFSGSCDLNFGDCLDVLGKHIDADIKCKLESANPILMPLCASNLETDSIKCIEDPSNINSGDTLSTDIFPISRGSNNVYSSQENIQDLVSAAKTSPEFLLFKSTSEDSERRERAAAKRSAFIKLIIMQGESTGASKFLEEGSQLNAHRKNNHENMAVQVDIIEDDFTSDLIDIKNRQFCQELSFLHWEGLTVVGHKVRKMLCKQQRSIKYKTMMRWLQLHSSKILFSISTLHRSRSVLLKAFESWTSVVNG